MKITLSGVEEEVVLEVGFESWAEFQQRRGTEENVVKGRKSLAF